MKISSDDITTIKDNEKANIQMCVAFSQISPSKALECSEHLLLKYWKV